MSKINAIQAEALKATTVEASKPVSKATVTKTATKPVIAKTTAVKATTATKPAPTSVAKSSTASNKKTVEKSVTKATEKTKVAKEKAPKLKMERDSFTMPKTEYAQFAVLKERLTKLGQPAKKSELLRAGIMQLSAMTDAALKAAMSKVPAIKTGRPKKK